MILSDEQLARAMPDGCRVFLRGRRPTLIQSESIPLILHGSSVLMSGPTASGKTEAAVAPLYQRHVSFRRDRLSVVYVAPTKALVNDLYERLTTYFAASSADIVQRYTGDYHGFRQESGAFLLLTTPEALDSLQLTQPALLHGVRAVVIDEIHALHGTARGQQLRHVVKRLSRAAAPPAHQRDGWHVVGMTATVCRPAEVAALWLGPAAVVVTAGQRRDIDQVTCRTPADTEGEATAVAAAIAGWLPGSERRKLLVFANTRNGAHALAAALRNRLRCERWPVHFHCGVLSLAERERVEGSMRSGGRGVCVATSTMELGVDIGDVDAVVLAEPPNSIAGYVQRIGRGNRRSGRCHVLAVSGTRDTDRLYGAMLACAQEGVLEDVHEYDRPSVRFQQVLSLSWRATRANSALTRDDLVSLTGESEHLPVVDDMVATGCLQDVGGALVPADDLMDQADHRKIHSVIEARAGVPIIDGHSGEVLATGGLQGEGGLAFLGGLAQLDARDPNATYVDRSVVDTRAKLARFATGRARRRGLTQPVMWALAAGIGLDPHHWTARGSCLQTWGGYEFNSLLAVLAQRQDHTAGIRYDDAGIVGLPAARDWSPAVFAHLVAESQNAADLRFDQMKRFRVSSLFTSYLSRDLQTEEARRAVPYGPVLSWLATCR
jgi:ATP-dependent Lhr-like helicase